MDKTYYKSINENVYHTITSKGLNVYIIKKEGFNTKSAYFATRFGSFNTGDKIIHNGEEITLIGGLAHFLEHRVFDYYNQNVTDLYYKLGADCNAYTSYDKTVYYFSTINNYEECLSLLLDYPTSFTMTEEAVENEKDIIVSELLMYKDDPNDQLYRALMSSIYKEHPIRYDVGGEPEEVRSTTIDLLRMVHSTFYNPKNMVLVIAGDVDIEKTMEIIESKDFKENNMHYMKKNLNEDLSVVNESVVVEADVNNKKMLIGYKLPVLDNLKEPSKCRTFISLDLLSSLLFSSSSDFFKTMIEEKYVSSLSVDILEFDGLFTFLIEADILKDEELILDKINERISMVSEVINQEKLNSIKKKEIAAIIKGSDSIDTLARMFTSYILEDMNYCEMIDIIKSIDVQDLGQVYLQYLKDAKYSYAILKEKKHD